MMSSSSKPRRTLMLLSAMFIHFSGSNSCLDEWFEKHYTAARLGSILVWLGFVSERRDATRRDGLCALIDFNFYMIFCSIYLIADYYLYWYCLKTAYLIYGYGMIVSNKNYFVFFKYPFLPGYKCLGSDKF